MTDIDINLESVYRALDIACLKQFVETLPQKHDTLLGTIGLELSGGQRQRLFIARAVYKNPEIIFFDEATNSLDANNELAIMTNLEDFFIDKTVIIIAHRLSTVKKADKIVVLENGKVIENGTHNELTRQCGSYYRLVKNQLELGN